MSIALLFVIGGLTTAGLYLITARPLSRIVLGFSMLGHAAVLALLATGGPAGKAPITDGTSEISNPLPQALSLTAIVISFGLTLFLLALAGRQQALTGDDLVEDDLEDRRIAESSDPQDDLEDRRIAESSDPQDDLGDHLLTGPSDPEVEQ